MADKAQKRAHSPIIYNKAKDKSSEKSSEKINKGPAKKAKIDATATSVAVTASTASTTSNKLPPIVFRFKKPETSIHVSETEIASPIENITMNMEGCETVCNQGKLTNYTKNELKQNLLDYYREEGIIPPRLFIKFYNKLIDKIKPYIGRYITVINNTNQIINTCPIGLINLHGRLFGLSIADSNKNYIYIRFINEIFDNDKCRIKGDHITISHTDEKYLHFHYTYNYKLKNGRYTKDNDAVCNLEMEKVYNIMKENLSRDAKFSKIKNLICYRENGKPYYEIPNVELKLKKNVVKDDFFVNETRTKLITLIFDIIEKGFQ